jgi:hypothetical protein
LRLRRRALLQQLRDRVPRPGRRGRLDLRVNRFRRVRVEPGYSQAATRTISMLDERPGL